MILAPTRRGFLTFRHVTKRFNVPPSNVSSALFAPSRVRSYHHVVMTSSPVIRSFDQPKIIAVQLLDNILSDGWNNRTAFIAISPTKRYHSTSSSIMTEKVLDLKTGGRGNARKTLYDPSRETENCGVGLIASLKSVPSRDIVQKADEMLVRMAHRGGCGCDPASGDGSGMSF
jgi:hypothetical protein